MLEIEGLDWLHWFVNIINFFIMFYLFRKVVIIPMQEMVRDREEQVQSKLRNIDAVVVEARGAEANYRKQFEKLPGEMDEMRAVADKEMARIKDRIHQEAEADAAHVVQKATNEAEKLKRLALADLQTEIAHAALGEARTLLAGALDKDSQANLVRTFLQRVGETSAA